MVEHSFRKAEVEGPTPSIGCMKPRSLFGGEFFGVVRDYLRKNFYWCIFWGIILQIAGSLLRPVHTYRQEFTILTTFMATFSYLFLLSGTALLLLGFYFYVKSKHRHSIWCLFALLPIIGWIVLVLLKDKNPLPLSEEDS